MLSGKGQPIEYQETTVDLQPSPLLPHPIEIKTLILPPKGYSLHLELGQCSHHNMPYVITSKPSSFFYQGLPAHLRHNV